MGSPDVSLPLAVTPEAVVQGEVTADRVEHATEGGRCPEQLRMGRGVVHGPEATHGEAGDDAFVTGAPVALDDVAQLGEMERLPRRGPPSPPFHQSE